MAEFRVLGPVELRVGREVQELGPPKRRAVFAALVVDSGRPVTVGNLVDRVWDDQPPAEARNALYGHILHLRRVLGAADGATIVRQSGGYLLDVDRCRVDLHQFRDLAEQSRGQALEPERRAARLREALALWQGTPLEGVRGSWAERIRQACHQQRIDAVVAWGRAELELGNHDRVIAKVLPLLGEYPLVEPLTAVFLHALHAAGRTAEALDWYAATRRRLVEELGVDPGAELRELHHTMLREGPDRTASASANAAGAGTTPRQLPLDVGTFVGRAGELATLRRLLAADASDGGPVLVIHGPPGVGKSALAVRAANLWSTGCADGHLYVNLRGATIGVEPLGPGEALGRFLRALGVAAADVPNDVEEAGALFRTLVADRRMLILLDNAASAAQVRPLLPGTSRSAVLVTSRASMTALDGAVHLALTPLDPGTSRVMLERLIGDARVAADPPATARLATLCDHLPLGLHVAAARLKARPTWPVQCLVDRLTDERHRLTELAAGDLAMRSSLKVSHAGLRRSDDPGDQAAARALCLIGLVPVTEIETSMATALFDASPAEADRVIERLLDAHLLEVAGDPDRYHMHDLVRLFTQELGAETVGGDEADATIIRVLGYYLATAAAAVRLAYPNRTHYPIPEVSAAPKSLAGSGEALRWLEMERANMLAVIRQSWNGSDEHARLGIGLTLALHWFFSIEVYPYDCLEVNEQAIAQARRLGDRRSEAYSRGAIGSGLHHVGRYEDAAAHIAAELSICQHIGDRFGEQRALGNLGLNHLLQDRPEEAITCLQRQLAVARQIGATIGEVFALRTLGRAHHQLGRLDQAVWLTKQALAWYEQTGDDHNACAALERLGLIYLDLGRRDEAVATLASSVERARRTRNRLGEAEALISLARAWRLFGARNQALSCAQEAIAITEALGLTRLRIEAGTEHVTALAAAR